MPPRFSHEQICKMLENSPNLISSANVVNMSGNSGALLVANEPQEWIIDTGATNHMASDLTMLSKHTVTKSTNPKKVVLPNGDLAHVIHTGTSNISNKSVIQNMFHVPQF